MAEPEDDLRSSGGPAAPRGSGKAGLVASSAGRDTGGVGLTDESWLDSFFFQQRHGRLNVRKLARLDLDELVAKVDIVSLQEVLENVAFCNLRAADLPALSDGMIVKAFRVAQLELEYLINLENSLYSRLEAARQEQAVTQGALDQAREDARVIADDNDALRRDVRAKRKALATLEYVLTVHGPPGIAAALAGGDALGALGGAAPALHASVCETCGKAFSSRQFLLKHCARRKHKPTDTALALGVGSNDENLDPNPTTRQLLEHQKEQAAHLAELRAALADAARSRADELAAAVNAAREAERRVYEEQVSALRESLRNAMLEQKAHYEQRIAELQGRLAALGDLKLSLAERDGAPRSPRDNGRDKEHDEMVKMAEALRLAAERAAALTQQRPRTPEPGEDLGLALSELQSQVLEQQALLRRVNLQNLVRTIANKWAARLRERRASAFAHWQQVVLLLKQQYSRRPGSPLSQRFAVAQSPQGSPQRAIAEHVASFFPEEEDIGGRGEPLTEEEVRQIMMRYMHAQKERGITDAERLAMEDVDAMLDTRASLIEQQFKVERQPLDYMPLPGKPYVRARWDHRPNEVRVQLQFVEQELEAKLARYDPAIARAETLTDDQYVRLMGQLQAAQAANPDKTLGKTVRAAQRLAADLVQEFYKPEGPPALAAQDPQGERPRDDLLSKAMVPLRSRGRADAPHPFDQGDRRSVGSSDVGSDAQHLSDLDIGSDEDEEPDRPMTGRAASATPQRGGATFPNLRLQLQLQPQPQPQPDRKPQVQAQPASAALQQLQPADVSPLPPPPSIPRAPVRQQDTQQPQRRASAANVPPIPTVDLIDLRTLSGEGAVARQAKPQPQPQLSQRQTQQSERQSQRFEPVVRARETSAAVEALREFNATDFAAQDWDDLEELPKDERKQR
jgi:hypothetical protein